MIRVAVVDDYEIVRQGLHSLLDAEPDLDVVAELGTYADALTEIPLIGPDVVVVDVRLPDGDGVDLCADLAEVAPDVRCVVLTAYPDDAAISRALDAHAAAFVLKEVDGSALVRAVREVAHGRTLLDSATTAYVAGGFRDAAHDNAGGPRLTPQEHRVVALVSEGLMNRQIGEHLGLSEKTVKNYVSNVLAKLGMSHRSEVAVYGARLAVRLAAREDREPAGAGRS